MGNNDLAEIFVTMPVRYRKIGSKKEKKLRLVKEKREVMIDIVIKRECAER